MIRYSVEAYPEVTEFEDIGQAVDKAELLPHATLIVWLVEDNLIGLKPDKVWKSLRMYTWDGDGWWAIAIHGPGNAKWKEEPSEY